MKLSSEDLERIVKYRTVPKDQRGCIVLLGGNMFKSNSGKSLFRKRQHALIALNNSLKWSVDRVVEEKLKAIGLTQQEIYRNAEYTCAWKNFVKQAEAEGFLQIVELK